MPDQFRHERYLLVYAAVPVHGSGSHQHPVRAVIERYGVPHCGRDRLFLHRFLLRDSSGAGLFLEMWMSIAVFLAAGILVLLWGCHTVKNYELVSSNRGAEGGY